MARAERILFAVAVVALGWYAAAWANTTLYQASQHRQLEELRLERADVRLPMSDTAPAPETVPTSEIAPAPEARPARDTAVAPGTTRERVTSDRGLIGRIDIPRLGVSAIVRAGVDNRTLRRAVGHVPETALPGEDGNMALAGHRDSFFRPLKRAVEGDVIHLRTPDGDYTYVVRDTRIVGPAEMSVLAPTPEPTLTLITCYPFHYVGDAPDRFIVRAERVDTAPARR
jgi:sortase A